MTIDIYEDEDLLLVFGGDLILLLPESEREKVGEVQLGDGEGEREGERVFFFQSNTSCREGKGKRGDLLCLRACA